MCGYMENRTKSLARKQKTDNKKTVDGDVDAISDDLQMDVNANLVPIDECDEDMQNLVNQMKSVVINDSNIEKIKLDLQKSREYRCKMLLDAKTDLLESYPYFFTNVDLVCYHSLHHFACEMHKCLYFILFHTLFRFQILFEFHDRFKNIDEMVFLNKWKTFGASFTRVLNDHYKTCLFYSGWDAEIEQILVPLKLFPASKVGRNANANNKTFQKAMNSLIVFRKVTFVRPWN